MKTTAEQRRELREIVRGHPGATVGLLLDDFEDTARELEDARDRLQVLELELGELRRRNAGGPP